MTERSIAAAEGVAVRESSRWRLLALLTLVQTGVSGLQFSLVALLPVIKSDLDLSVTRTVVLASAINAGALLAAVPAGQVTNRLGERRALTAGAVTAGIAVIVAAMLSTMWLMRILLLVAGCLAGLLCGVVPTKAQGSPVTVDTCRTLIDQYGVPE